MGWLLTGLIVLYALYCLVFLFLQSVFIFRPQKLPASFVFNPGVPFEEIKIKATDGTLLHGLLLQPDAPGGTVIYFHGNWKNLENYLPFTKKFTDLGYRVLIPDYRSFGKSEGRLTEPSFLGDTFYWYDYAISQCPSENIYIYGRSLGTAAAAYLAANRHCKQLILETPFVNMYDIARRYGMPFPNGNYLSFSLRNDSALKAVTVPVLILHGTKDETVSIKSGRKLKEYLKPGDRFVEIEKGKHKNLNEFKEYHLALENFMKQVD